MTSIRARKDLKKANLERRNRERRDRKKFLAEAKGDQGPPGEKGDPGAPGQPGTDGRGFKWRGNFRPGRTYYGADDNPEYLNHYDTVEHDGSSWVCLRKTTERPRKSSSAWELMAAAGKDGKEGERKTVVAGGGGGASTLSELNDVSSGEAVDGDVLSYDAEEQKWKPGQVDAVPLGGLVFVDTSIAGASDPAPAENYIRLKAGEDGAGDYNEGKLTGETVSGTAPYITATAAVADTESPMDGQTVRLLETERRFLRAGSPGTLEDDTLKSHRHHAFTQTGATGSNGNLKDYVAITIASNLYGSKYTGYTGDDETRPRNMGIAVYMRIK